MKNILHSILLSVYAFGIDPVKFIRAIRGLPGYLNDLAVLRQQKNDNNDFPFGRYFPILDDRYAEGGTMKGHYFHLDLLIARKIYHNKPVHHVDIGSRTDGFVAHVAVFREIELLDIRPIESKIKQVSFRQADLMKLPEDMISYCDSVSALHSIEHFGLGRYGDSVDYDGHIKALENIYKMLKEGGVFYFAVPIGPQRIEFNAHRVFAISYLIGLFGEKFEIKSFSYVDDMGDLHEDVAMDERQNTNNYNCNYGCGIFELRKR
jgi:SAM-dependent methyltransferase